jgi:hypothetical protein
MSTIIRYINNNGINLLIDHPWGRGGTTVQLYFPETAQYIYFDWVPLNAQWKGTHLGHIIGPNVCSYVIQDAYYTLISSVNSGLHNFTHCSYNMKYQLLKCDCPVVWNVTNYNISSFYISWRKSIRKWFDLPYRTHCNLLTSHCRMISIKCQILCHFSKFYM